MKKVLILITGQLRFFDVNNYHRIIQSLKIYDVEFVLFPWKNQDKSQIEKFKKIYKPLQCFFLKEKNFSNIISKIKYPDYGNTMDNMFYMWDGIVQALDILNSLDSIRKWKPDYLLRYRSDILPKKNQEFMIPKNLNDNDIVLPDRYHWNGINDQIFLINYSKIKIFSKFYQYINKHLINKKFFCSEYIFNEFLNYSKISIVYNEFDYNIMRSKKKVLQNYKKSIIPFQDLIKIKILKLKFILRNFFSYVLKKKRNRFQDIIV